jgi:hypothetical protein
MFVWAGTHSSARKIGADFHGPVLEEVVINGASRDTPVLAIARTETKVLWTSARRVAHPLVMDCRQDRRHSLSDICGDHGLWTTHPTLMQVTDHLPKSRLTIELA